MGKIVYICHPYSDDPGGNREKVARICERIVDLVSCNDVVPIPVHLYMHQFMDEPAHSDMVLEMCLKIVDVCNEVWVIGNKISDGMREEINRAVYRKIPLRFFAYDWFGLSYE